MTHVWQYKFNIATKTTQICDQPKECEESGRKCLYMLGSRATKLVTAPWRIGRLSVLRTQKRSRLYHSVKPCNYNEKVCLVCHTSVHYPTEYVPRSTNLTQRSLSRVLSRIYHLGEKSRVAEGQELPRAGGGGRGVRKFFLDEYALRYNLVHFETQFWEMLQCGRWPRRVWIIFPI